MTTTVENIWESFHKELKVFVGKKVGYTADVDDILQDVFMKITLNTHRVNQAKNLRQYIYGIVKNTTVDYLRKQQKQRVEIAQEAVWMEKEGNCLNVIIAGCCVQPFIDQLPEKYREALLLVEFENIPQKELAAKLNISYSGAKSRVQRGREQLKQLIENCCTFESDAYGNLIVGKNGNCPC